MKKIKFFVLLAVVMLCTACHDKLWDSIEDLDSRVTKLEELCKEMNTNISALQTIVEVIQENDFITGIVPIEKGGEVIGYTIMFGKHEPITIYNGEDGKDGQNGSATAPIIGVAKDTDGVYYWTLNGEWLLDDEGNKIRVTGRDGKDGADGKDGTKGTNGVDGKEGVTPQLKIEEGYWYVSYDNGATWTELGKAVGEDGEKGDKGDKGDAGEKGNKGDSMFTNVTYDENYVYFTLTDGSVLIVPRGNSASDFDQTVIDNLVNSLELDKDTIFLNNIGDKDTIIAITLPFSNSKVIWTSSDTTIAIVNDGIVEAIEGGKVFITAQAGTLTKRCDIIIKASGLEFNHEYINLGLSVKWATCNIGANNPEECGNYFAWGETCQKENYDWTTYKYCNGYENTLTKYNTNSYYGNNDFIDNKIILEPEDDAAHVNWGGKWRMPTKEEQYELLSKCTWSKTVKNGIGGFLVTSKVEGYTDRCIFLPFAGHFFASLSSVGEEGKYWSSSLDTYPSGATFLSLNKNTIGPTTQVRFLGFSIRPVCP